jgi:hypothetical protein
MCGADRGDGDVAATEYQIGALWIGGDLSFVEQLCLKSFVDAGQTITLFCYTPVGNVPGGVRVEDAGGILPAAAFLRHAATQSPALHSDLFRYHMLNRRDRMIWADTDAYCVKPFTTVTGHFHGWESDLLINGGVLGLPQDSATLAALLAFTSDEYAIPYFYADPFRSTFVEARARGAPVHASDMPWGVWGPHALTYFLRKTGEVRHSLPQAAFYPFGYRERKRLLAEHLDEGRHVSEETYSIHLYGRRMKRRIFLKHDGIPPEASLIGRLLAKHGIDPKAAPILFPAGDAGVEGERDD